MIDLNDRRFADALVGIVDRLVEQKLRKLSTTQYGTVVGAPDTTRRTVAVALNGKPEPSPGFVYGEIQPVEGDVVRVVIDPRGDRYVDAVMGRSVESGFSGELAAALIVDRPLITDTAIEVRQAGTPTFEMTADGVANFGDANLYRLLADTLRTDDSLQVGGDLEVDGALAVAGLVSASATALSGDTTPTIAGGGTATFTSRNCQWVQIGRLVVFRVGFVVNAAGSGATGVTVTGTALPPSITNFAVAGDRATTGLTRTVGRMIVSGGEVQIGEIRNLSGYVQITGADLASTASYQWHGSYIAA